MDDARAEFLDSRDEPPNADGSKLDFIDAHLGDESPRFFVSGIDHEHATARLKTRDFEAFSRFFAIAGVEVDDEALGDGFERFEFIITAGSGDEPRAMEGIG